MAYRIAKSQRLIPQSAPEFLKTTLGSALDVADPIPVGFPYIVDERTQEPFAPALSYLLWASVNGTRSPASAKNRADHLYEWLLYLEALGADFRAIGFKDIQRYSHQCAAYISPLTRAPLEPGTIRGRISTILEFYRFAEDQGWVPAGTIPAKPPRVSGTGLYRNRSPNSVLAELAPASRKRMVEYVSDDNLTRIFSSLQRIPETARTRDWLIAIFCVTTGTRIFETLALTVHQVLEFHQRRERDPRAKLRLVETKGGVPRDIDVPLEVVEYLLAYIDGERSRAIAEALKWKALRKEHKRVFVNGIDAPRPWVGHRYKEKRAEEAFAKAQEAIGLVRELPIFEPGTRAIVGTRQSPLHVLHHLRHTYAVKAWYAYRHLPEADRWIRIQHQLGHASHTTTANTYLRSVRLSDASARDAYGDTLKLIAGLTP